MTAGLVKYDVGGAIGIGVCLLLAWALVRGRNLARYAFAAGVGLDWLAMFQAAGQGATVNARADMTAAAVTWFLILPASVLLFTRPSSRYYRPKPSGRSRVAADLQH